MQLAIDQIKALQEDAEQHLIYRPELRHCFSGLDTWHLSFPDAPGVYAIFISNVIVYVGESGNLRARMRDLRETRNHTFRRHHGKELFHKRPGFVAATSSRCFESDLETELTNHMGEHVQICSVVVHFGRKEIEEHLSSKYKPKYCRSIRRLG